MLARACFLTSASLLLACGSDTVVAGPGGGSGGGAVASSSSSGGPGGFGASSSSSGGQGGAVASCEAGGFVLVDDPGGDFFQVCDWGSDVASGPVAYDVLPGPGPGPLTAVVEACDGQGEFRVELPGPLATGSYNVAMTVGVYWTSSQETELIIDEVGSEGGYVKGSFTTTLIQLDQDFPDTTGSFCATRVPDFAAP